MTRIRLDLAVKKIKTGNIIKELYHDPESDVEVHGHGLVHTARFKLSAAAFRAGEGYGVLVTPETLARVHIFLHVHLE